MAGVDQMPRRLWLSMALELYELMVHISQYDISLTALCAIGPQKYANMLIYLFLFIYLPTH